MKTSAADAARDFTPTLPRTRNQPARRPRPRSSTGWRCSAIAARGRRQLLAAQPCRAASQARPDQHRSTEVAHSCAISSSWAGGRNGPGFIAGDGADTNIALHVTCSLLHSYTVRKGGQCAVHRGQRPLPPVVAAVLAAVLHTENHRKRTVIAGSEEQLAKWVGEAPLVAGQQDCSDACMAAARLFIGRRAQCSKT